MNKMTRNVLLTGFLLVCTYTMFSLHRASDLQKSRQSDISTLQTQIDLDAPMTMDSQVVLRLANNQGPEHPASVACDYFANLVDEMSGSRIRILTYHSGRLGDEKSTVQQVVYGGIDIARVSTALLIEYEPRLIALQMPYLYENSDHMWKVLNSSIGEDYLSCMEDIGVVGLCWYDAGARNFYTADNAVSSVEDLEGMKIRVQESSLMVDVISALGAVPVQIPYDRVAAALREGEIDGAENNVSSYISMGHYTKAPYIVNDEHVRIPEMIIINKSVLESLSQEDQEIIRTAAAKSSLRQRQLWDEQEENNRKTLEKAGAVITEVENKEEFIKSVQPVYQKYGESYEDIVAQIREMKD